MGGQAMVVPSYLDGTYSEFYPEISQNIQGMTELFKTIFISWGNWISYDSANPRIYA